jgi:hypothetical protein
MHKDDIVAIGTSRWFVNLVVYFELKDGRRLGTNLIQGARVRFPEGATKDAVAVLERDLGVARTVAHDRPGS